MKKNIKKIVVLAMGITTLAVIPLSAFLVVQAQNKNNSKSQSEVGSKIPLGIAKSGNFRKVNDGVLDFLQTIAPNFDIEITDEELEQIKLSLEEVDLSNDLVTKFVANIAYTQDLSNLKTSEIINLANFVLEDINLSMNQIRNVIYPMIKRSLSFSEEIMSVIDYVIYNDDFVNLIAPMLGIKNQDGSIDLDKNIDTGKLIEILEKIAIYLDEELSFKNVLEISSIVSDYLQVDNINDFNFLFEEKVVENIISILNLGNDVSSKELSRLLISIDIPINDILALFDNDGNLDVPKLIETISNNTHNVQITMNTFANVIIPLIKSIDLLPTEILNLIENIFTNDNLQFKLAKSFHVLDIYNEIDYEKPLDPNVLDLLLSKIISLINNSSIEIDEIIGKSLEVLEILKIENLNEIIPVFDKEILGSLFQYLNLPKDLNGTEFFKLIENVDFPIANIGLAYESYKNSDYEGLISNLSPFIRTASISFNTLETVVIPVILSIPSLEMYKSVIDDLFADENIKMQLAHFLGVLDSEKNIDRNKIIDGQNLDILVTQIIDLVNVDLSSIEIKDLINKIFDLLETINVKNVDDLTPIFNSEIFNNYVQGSNLNIGFDFKEAIKVIKSLSLPISEIRDLINNLENIDTSSILNIIDQAKDSIYISFNTIEKLILPIVEKLDTIPQNIKQLFINIFNNDQIKQLLGQTFNVINPDGTVDKDKAFDNSALSTIFNSIKDIALNGLDTSDLKATANTVSSILKTFNITNTQDISDLNLGPIAQEVLTIFKVDLPLDLTEALKVLGSINVPLDNLAALINDDNSLNLKAILEMIEPSLDTIAISVNTIEKVVLPIMDSLQIIDQPIKDLVHSLVEHEPVKQLLGQTFNVINPDGTVDKDKAFDNSALSTIFNSIKDIALNGLDTSDLKATANTVSSILKTFNITNTQDISDLNLGPIAQEVLTIFKVDLPLDLTEALKVLGSINVPLDNLAALINDDNSLNLKAILEMIEPSLDTIAISVNTIEKVVLPIMDSLQIIDKPIKDLVHSLVEHEPVKQLLGQTFNVINPDGTVDKDKAFDNSALSTIFNSIKDIALNGLDTSDLKATANTVSSLLKTFNITNTQDISDLNLGPIAQEVLTIFKVDLPIDLTEALKVLGSINLPLDNLATLINDDNSLNLKAILEMIEPSLDTIAISVNTIEKVILPIMDSLQIIDKPIKDLVHSLVEHEPVKQLLGQTFNVINPDGTVDKDKAFDNSALSTIFNSIKDIALNGLDTSDLKATANTVSSLLKTFNITNTQDISDLNLGPIAQEVLTIFKVDLPIDLTEALKVLGSINLPLDNLATLINDDNSLNLKAILEMIEPSLDTIAISVNTIEKVILPIMDSLQIIDQPIKDLVHSLVEHEPVKQLLGQTFNVINPDGTVDKDKAFDNSALSTIFNSIKDIALNGLDTSDLKATANTVSSLLKTFNITNTQDISDLNLGPIAQEVLTIFKVDLPIDLTEALKVLGSINLPLDNLATLINDDNSLNLKAILEMIEPSLDTIAISVNTIEKVILPIMDSLQIIDQPIKDLVHSLVEHEPVKQLLGQTFNVINPDGTVDKDKAFDNSALSTIFNSIKDIALNGLDTSDLKATANTVSSLLKTFNITNTQDISDLNLGPIAQEVLTIFKVDLPIDLTEALKVLGSINLPLDNLAALINDDNSLNLKAILEMIEPSLDTIAISVNTIEKVILPIMDSLQIIDQPIKDLVHSLVEHEPVKQLLGQTFNVINPDGTVDKDKAFDNSALSTIFNSIKDIALNGLDTSDLKATAHTVSSILKTFNINNTQDISDLNLGPIAQEVLTIFKVDLPLDLTEALKVLGSINLPLDNLATLINDDNSLNLKAILEMIEPSLDTIAISVNTIEKVILPIMDSLQIIDQPIKDLVHSLVEHEPVKQLLGQTFNVINPDGTVDKDKAFDNSALSTIFNSIKDIALNGLDTSDLKATANTVSSLLKTFNITNTQDISDLNLGPIAQEVLTIFKVDLPLDLTEALKVLGSINLPLDNLGALINDDNSLNLKAILEMIEPSLDTIAISVNTIEKVILPIMDSLQIIDQPIKDLVHSLVEHEPVKQLLGQTFNVINPDGTVDKDKAFDNSALSTIFNSIKDIALNGLDTSDLKATANTVSSILKTFNITNTQDISDLNLGPIAQEVLTIFKVDLPIDLTEALKVLGSINLPLDNLGALINDDNSLNLKAILEMIEPSLDTIAISVNTIEKVVLPIMDSLQIIDQPIKDLVHSLVEHEPVKQLLGQTFNVINPDGTVDKDKAFDNSALSTIFNSIKDIALNGLDTSDLKATAHTVSSLLKTFNITNTQDISDLNLGPIAQEVLTIFKVDLPIDLTEALKVLGSINVPLDNLATLINDDNSLNLKAILEMIEPSLDTIAISVNTIEKVILPIMDSLQIIDQPIKDLVHSLVEHEPVKQLLGQTFNVINSDGTVDKDKAFDNSALSTIFNSIKDIALNGLDTSDLKATANTVSSILKTFNITNTQDISDLNLGPIAQEVLTIFKVDLPLDLTEALKVLGSINLPLDNLATLINDDNSLNLKAILEMIEPSLDTIAISVNTIEKVILPIMDSLQIIDQPIKDLVHSLVEHEPVKQLLGQTFNVINSDGTVDKDKAFDNSALSTIFNSIKDIALNGLDTSDLKATAHTVSSILKTFNITNTQDISDLNLGPIAQEVLTIFKVDLPLDLTEALKVLGSINVPLDNLATLINDDNSLNLKAILEMIEPSLDTIAISVNTIEKVILPIMDSLQIIDQPIKDLVHSLVEHEPVKQLLGQTFNVINSDGTVDKDKAFDNSALSTIFNSIKDIALNGLDTSDLKATAHTVSSLLKTFNITNTQDISDLNLGPIAQEVLTIFKVDLPLDLTEALKVLGSINLPLDNLGALINDDNSLNLKAILEMIEPSLDTIAISVNTIEKVVLPIMDSLQIIDQPIKDLVHSLVEHEPVKQLLGQTFNVINPDGTVDKDKAFDNSALSTIFNSIKDIALNGLDTSDLKATANTVSSILKTFNITNTQDISDLNLGPIAQEVLTIFKVDLPIDLTEALKVLGSINLPLDNLATLINDDNSLNLKAILEMIEPSLDTIAISVNTIEKVVLPIMDSLQIIDKPIKDLVHSLVEHEPVKQLLGQTFNVINSDGTVDKDKAFDNSALSTIFNSIKDIALNGLDTSDLKATANTVSSILKTFNITNTQDISDLNLGPIAQEVLTIFKVDLPIDLTEALKVLGSINLPLDNLATLINDDNSLNLKAILEMIEPSLDTIAISVNTIEKVILPIMDSLQIIDKPIKDLVHSLVEHEPVKQLLGQTFNVINPDGTVDKDKAFDNSALSTIFNSIKDIALNGLDTSDLKATANTVSSILKTFNITNTQDISDLNLGPIAQEVLTIFKVDLPIDLTEALKVLGSINVPLDNLATLINDDNSLNLKAILEMIEPSLDTIAISVNTIEKVILPIMDSLQIIDQPIKDLVHSLVEHEPVKQLLGQTFNVINPDGTVDKDKAFDNSALSTIFNSIKDIALNGLDTSNPQQTLIKVVDLMELLGVKDTQTLMPLVDENLVKTIMTQLNLSAKIDIPELIKVLNSINIKFNDLRGIYDSDGVVNFENILSIVGDSIDSLDISFNTIEKVISPILNNVEGVPTLIKGIFNSVLNDEELLKTMSKAFGTLDANGEIDRTARINTNIIKDLLAAVQPIITNGVDANDLKGAADSIVPVLIGMGIENLNQAGAFISSDVINGALELAGINVNVDTQKLADLIKSINLPLKDISSTIFDSEGNVDFVGVLKLVKNSINDIKISLSTIRNSILPLATLVPGLPPFISDVIDVIFNDTQFMLKLGQAFGTLVDGKLDENMNVQNPQKIVDIIDGIIPIFEQNLSEDDIPKILKLIAPLFPIVGVNTIGDGMGVLTKILPLVGIEFPLTIQIPALFFTIPYDITQDRLLKILDALKDKEIAKFLGGIFTESGGIDIVGVIANVGGDIFKLITALL